LALSKVRRNIRLLLNQIFPEGTKRFEAQRNAQRDQEVMKATERFLAHFFRARGLLPSDPLASREEMREAAKEMEIIKQVLSPEDLQHIKTMLKAIDDFLGKNEVESAIAKMVALWTWMVTQAFPPPWYIK